MVELTRGSSLHIARGSGPHQITLLCLLYLYDINNIQIQIQIQEREVCMLTGGTNPMNRLFIDSTDDYFCMTGGITSSERRVGLPVQCNRHIPSLQ